MKLALISDLHLSTPGPACAFTWPLERALAQLDALERDHDAIALVGDVFDHKIGPAFPRQRRDLDAARRRWAPLVERLQRPHVHWIFGNNDALLAREGAPELWVLESCGARLGLLHGHQLAPLHQWFEAIKYPVKAFAAWEQRGPDLLGRVLYRINDLVTQPPEGSGRPTRTERGALALLRARGDLDILVCGHDHRPRVVRSDAGIYANAGTWTHGRMDWLSIDMARRAVTIHSGA